jgi:hypothetical protein
MVGIDAGAVLAVWATLTLALYSCLIVAGMVKNIAIWYFTKLSFPSCSMRSLSLWSVIDNAIAVHLVLSYEVNAVSHNYRIP